MSSRITTAWFPMMLGLIALVSAYDTALIVYFQEEIYWTEQNPVGWWLLEAAAGEVGVFVRAKLAGTVVVLSILTGMRIYRSRKTLPVTTSIAAYQTGLFTYLTFY